MEEGIHVAEAIGTEVSVESEKPSMRTVYLQGREVILIDVDDDNDIEFSRKYVDLKRCLGEVFGVNCHVRMTSNAKPNENEKLGSYHNDHLEKEHSSFTFKVLGAKSGSGTDVDETLAKTNLVLANAERGGKGMPEYHSCSSHVLKKNRIYNFHRKRSFNKTATSDDVEIETERGFHKIVLRSSKQVSRKENDKDSVKEEQMTSIAVDSLKKVTSDVAGNVANQVPPSEVANQDSPVRITSSNYNGVIFSDELETKKLVIGAGSNSPEKWTRRCSARLVDKGILGSVNKECTPNETPGKPALRVQNVSGEKKEMSKKDPFETLPRRTVKTPRRLTRCTTSPQQSDEGKSEDSPNRHQCHLCPKNYHTAVNLRRHIHHHHPNDSIVAKYKKPKVFTCNICGKHHDRKANLEKHRLKYHLKDP